MSAAQALLDTLRSSEREATSLKLFEIVDELSAIADVLYENGGVIEPDLEARLDALEGALPVKVDRICCVIQNNQRAAEAAKAEADRLNSLAKSRDNTAKALKSYLMAAMIKQGSVSVMTDRFTVRIQKNSAPSIRWIRDVSELPEAFQKIKIEMDGTAAHAALKRKEPLPEGFVIEHGSHVRIS